LCEALSVSFEDDMYLKVDWEHDITQTKFKTQLCGGTITYHDGEPNPTPHFEIYPMGFGSINFR
jgi:hypothetical protein